MFVYSNLGAFRVALGVISSEHEKMEDAEFRGRIVAMAERLNAAATRGQTWVPMLHARAREPFWPMWALTGR